MKISAELIRKIFFVFVSKVPRLHLLQQNIFINKNGIKNEHWEDNNATHFLMFFLLNMLSMLSFAKVSEMQKLTSQLKP